MASFTEVREAIADALSVIDGLQVYAYEPGQIVAPAAVVVPDDPAVQFDSTMARGSDEFRLLVRVLVSRQVDRPSSEQLDAYLAGSGDKSIKQAVEAAGDPVHFAVVEEARDYDGDHRYGEVLYAGVELAVRCVADGRS